MKKNKTKEFKVYQWNFESEETERLGDMEFEIMHTGNLKHEHNGSSKRLNIDEVVNQYRQVRLLNGNYVMLFDMEFEVDEIMVHNSIIDKFIESSNRKIHYIKKTIESDLFHLESKIEYWESLRR